MLLQWHIIYSHLRKPWSTSPSVSRAGVDARPRYGPCPTGYPGPWQEGGSPSNVKSGGLTKLKKLSIYIYIIYISYSWFNYYLYHHYLTIFHVYITILWHFFLWRAYSVSTARFSPKIRKFKNSKIQKIEKKHENSKIRKFKKLKNRAKIQKFENSKKQKNIRKFENLKKHIEIQNSKIPSTGIHITRHPALATGHASGRENHRQRPRNESAPIEKSSIHVAKISVQDIQ